MRKILMLGLIVLNSTAWTIASAHAANITVYKSPTCGCCNKWIQHLEVNGFSVNAINVRNVTPYKLKHGVTRPLASCHTATVGGYTIEGHVPAADIKRLLREKPGITGLAVPGMPMGSPGMEGHRKDAYDVVTFDKSGKTGVFSSHK